MPAGGVAGFGDVGEDRFFTEPVQWMVDNDITTGTSPTCFSPNDPVTRGQAAAFMWRMEGEPPAGAGHAFTDVTRDWQQEPVSWMSRNGITTGTSPTTYDPERNLTRGEMAALVHRLAGSPTGSPAHPFTDVVRSWQQEPVSWMADTGITTGTSPTTFDPDRTVTRGELATFLYRYSGSPDVKVRNVHPVDPACPDQVPGPNVTVPPTTSTTAPPPTTTMPSDTTPPTAPGTLTAAPVTCAVDLDWTASSDPDSELVSYTISRGTSPGGAKTPIATISKDLTAYRDTAVAGGVAYSYTVTALNTSGLTSAASNEATATPVGTVGAPASPGTLGGASGISTAVISWTGSPDAIAEYTVSRGTSPGGAKTVVATLPGTQLEYTDTDVTVGTTYYYQVVASNCSGLDSPATNEVEVTVDSTFNDGSLVAAWLLDEGAGTTATDISGNGNDGTFVGTPEYVAGAVGTGLRFRSAESEAVSVPDAASLDFGTNGFTVALWIRYVAENDADIIRKGSLATGPKYWKLEFPAASQRLSFELFTGTGLARVRAPESYGDGQWHHIVAVRDVSAGLLRLYVDGVEVTTAPDPTGDVSNTSGLSIGAKDTLDDDFFDGSVDSVRLYDRALSPGEVAMLFDLGG
jgi:hypothetical protein